MRNPFFGWRHASPGLLIASVALFVALGGTAAAVSGGLGGYPASDYRQNTSATLLTNQITLKQANTFKSLLSETLFNSGSKNSPWLASSDVSLTNSDKTEPMMVTFRLSLNNHLQPETYSETVPPAGTISVPSQFSYDKGCKKCGGLLVGNNRVILLARASGAGDLIVSSASLTALRPIVVPPGRSYFTGPAEP